jgi:hypothetical protein
MLRHKPSSLREKVGASVFVCPQQASKPMSRPELFVSHRCVVDSPDTPALRLVILSAWKKGEVQKQHALLALPPRRRHASASPSTLTTVDQRSQCTPESINSARSESTQLSRAIGLDHGIQFTTQHPPWRRRLDRDPICARFGLAPTRIRHIPGPTHTRRRARSTRPR